MKRRVAVVDSGVHAAHPHVNGVAGGIAIYPDGREDTDFTDRLGHGTAVAAAIREKAADAEIFAVKIFHESLTTHIESLVRAIEWSVRNQMDLINLSLGTSNQAHESLLRESVASAVRKGSCIVAAAEEPGTRWLPGAIEGVLAVELDWDCDRSHFRIRLGEGGRAIYGASGYPRPIPGVPPERNLKGLSFAVANVTGLLAATGRACPGP
jgi:subtilisin family serine protease